MTRPATSDDPARAPHDSGDPGAPAPADPGRLSRIETRWTLIRIAPEASDEAMRARDTLLRDYHGAVYRYLLGITRDPDAAEDLCQTFSLRFIQGRYRNADPDRGRFRDYLKAALRNLVRDERRTPSHEVTLADAELLADPSKGGFEEAWSEAIRDRTWDVLERTWEALEEDRPKYGALLAVLRVEPGLRSPEVVSRLARGRPAIEVNATWVRKAKPRAFAAFGEQLIDEVASTLDDGDLDALEQELAALKLLPYCRSALERRRARGRL